MRRSTLRFLAAAALGLAGGSALAETYTAQIYAVPAGYALMYVFGGGDNKMMSGYVQTASGPPQAAYRTSTGTKIMHPTGWYASHINDSWGSTYHCGSGSLTPVSSDHALFWLGGGAAVDMHPAGAEYSWSEAVGGGGQLQAGSVQGSINCAVCGISMTRHAGMWSRTAASFQRLHSNTHTNTFARSTDGFRFVGGGVHRTDGSYNALIWDNSSSNARNLRPSMSTFSVANSTFSTEQGGYFVGPSTGGHGHAVLWKGTAASAVDLNPNATFSVSEVKAVRSGLQVGSATPLTTPSRTQAIAWHGTAGSWINLHSKLPAPFNLWHSYAEGIDEMGNITGFILNPAATDARPVVWVRS
jgi:hypothetical protein